MATTTLAKPNRVPKTRNTIWSDGSSSVAVRPSTVVGVAEGLISEIFAELEAMDDVVVSIDKLVMRVASSTMVCEGTALVGSVPEEKSEPNDWFMVTKLAMATAQPASNNQSFGIGMFLLAVSVCHRIRAMHLGTLQHKLRKVW